MDQTKSIPSFQSVFHPVGPPGICHWCNLNQHENWFELNWYKFSQLCEALVLLSLSLEPGSLIAFVLITLSSWGAGWPWARHGVGLNILKGNSIYCYSCVASDIMCVLFTLRSLLSPFLLCYAFLLLCVSWLRSPMLSRPLTSVFADWNFPKARTSPLTISSPLAVFLVQSPKAPSDSKLVRDSVPSSDLTSGMGRSTGEAVHRDGGPHGLQEGRLMLPWAQLSQRRFSSAQRLGSHTSRKSRLSFST